MLFYSKPIVKKSIASPKMKNASPKMRKQSSNERKTFKVYKVDVPRNAEMKSVVYKPVFKMQATKQKISGFESSAAHFNSTLED